MSVSVVARVSVLLVCLAVPSALPRTLITAYLECNEAGAECLYLHQCLPDSRRFSSFQCREDMVCCQRDRPHKVRHSRGRILKSLYLRPEEDGLTSFVLPSNMEYTVDRNSDEDNVDTRIVNIALLNNTLATPTASYTTSTSSENSEGDNIVFPEKSEEELDDRIKYIKMLYQKYAADFKRYNSHMNTDVPKKKPKYAVGYKSNKYCRLYEKYSVDEALGANPLLPSTFPMPIRHNHCSKPLPLIVGGINASKGEFPHMAGLGYDRGEWVDFLCGGSLISDRFVLTAAHCGHTKWGPPILVRLGTRNLITDVGQNVDVEKVFVHPDYHEPSSYNDIALIKIVSAVQMSRSLRPACLPHVGTKAGDPGSYLTATGWGRTGYGLFSSPNLQKVSLAVVDNTTCEKTFIGGRKSERLPSGIHSSMLCAAGYMDSSHDTCQGDSGGPLQALTPHSKCMHEVVGITSFGKLCGTGLPAIYTRVSTYLSWIEDIVWPS